MSVCFSFSSTNQFFFQLQQHSGWLKVNVTLFGKPKPNYKNGLTRFFVAILVCWCCKTVGWEKILFFQGFAKMLWWSPQLLMHCFLVLSRDVLNFLVELKCVWSVWGCWGCTAVLQYSPVLESSIHAELRLAEANPLFLHKLWKEIFSAWKIMEIISLPSAHPLLLPNSPHSSSWRR